MYERIIDIESPVRVAGFTASGHRGRRDSDPRAELLPERYGTASPLQGRLSPKVWS